MTGGLFERKFDGERCVARKRGGDVRLKSRTGKDLTATYPEVPVPWSRSTQASFCLTVRWSATKETRHPSAGFSSASAPPRPTGQLIAAYPVVYCVFDGLEIDGEVLTDRPLEERRARLTRALRTSPALQVSHGLARRRSAAV